MFLIERLKLEKSKLWTAIFVSTLISGAGVANATPLNLSNGGQLNFGNLSVQVTGTPSTGCINFYNASFGTCNTSGSDVFTVNQPSDSTLFVGNSSGNIKDIPASVAGAEPAFITLTGANSLGLISFDLLSLVIPNSTPCSSSQPNIAGSCGLPGSPFLFGYNGNPSSATTVSFAANLCGYSGASGGVNCSNGTLYSGTFTSPFSGTSAQIQNLINQSQTATGITNGVTANLTAVVPEPGTSLLLGMGLLAVGFAARKLRA